MKHHSLILRKTNLPTVLLISEFVLFANAFSIALFKAFALKPTWS
jgi:hypothetical protein